MSKHHQMNADQFPESQEELERLLARAKRYLDYARDPNKGNMKAKALSLAIMISIERVKAVQEYRRKHPKLYEVRYTRWQYFKKAVWK